MKFLKHLICATLVSLILATIPAANAEVAVIVNPGNNTNISEDDIKRIFLGKLKSFPGGGTALAINLNASEASRQSFESKMLGKSASQVKAYWSKLVFSGKGTPPREVANDQEVLQLVKENPAIIGYIDSANVSADVKVITKF